MDQSNIPPGGTPADAADDVPIMATEGEFIFPAPVVRYIGLDKLEKLKADAEVALKDMDARDGEDPELPFDLSTLVGMDDKSHPPPKKMAKGGVVDATQPVGIKDKGTGSFTGIKQYKDDKGNVRYVPFIYGEPTTPIPEGFVDTSVTDPKVTDKAPNPNANVAQSTNTPTAYDRYSGNDAGHDPARGEKQQASPLAGDPKNWSYDDFMDFEKSKGSVGEKAIKGMIGMLPGGGIAMKARQSYLDKTTADLVDQMLDTKVDPQGNPLSPEQMVKLSTTRENMKSQMSDHTGLNLTSLPGLGAAFQKFSDFIGGKTTSLSHSPGFTGGSGGGNVGKPAAGTNMLNQQYNGSSGQNNGTNASQGSTGGSYGMGSDMGRDPSQGPSSGQMASGGLYAKGGLVRRRTK